MDRLESEGLAFDALGSSRPVELHASVSPGNATARSPGGHCHHCVNLNKKHKKDLLDLFHLFQIILASLREVVRSPSV